MKRKNEKIDGGEEREWRWRQWRGRTKGDKSRVEQKKKTNY